MRGSPPKPKGGLLPPPANGGGDTGVGTAGAVGLSSGSGGAFPWLWWWSRSAAMVVATAELPVAAAHLVKKARREPKTYEAAAAEPGARARAGTTRATVSRCGAQSCSVAPRTLAAHGCEAEEADAPGTATSKLPPPSVCAACIPAPPPSPLPAHFTATTTPVYQAQKAPARARACMHVRRRVSAWTWLTRHRDTSSESRPPV